MIKNLLSIRLRSTFAAMKNRGGASGKSSVGRGVLFAVLYLYLAVTFLGIFSYMAFTLASATVAAGLDAMYFGMFMLVSFSVVFILSIFETKSELFDCKDNELLLSMPIKPGDIVISRIAVVLVYNYIETAFVMLPAIVVYAIFDGSLAGIVGAVLVSLLLPLLATALSSGVGYAVAAVSRRFKKNSFVTLTVSLAAMALYFVGYSALIGKLENITENEGYVMAEIPALTAIGGAAMLSPLPFAALAVLSVAAALLAWKIISDNYISIVTDNRGAKRVEYRARSLQRSSAFMALSRKELGRFLGSTNYMLNGGIGAVFMPVAAIVALVNRESVEPLISELSLMGIDGRGVVSVLVATGLLVVGSMTMISSSALSLEGKSLWILKSMPIPARTVLLAKCVPHFLVTTIFSVPSSVLFAIAVGAPIWSWLFILLIPVVGNVVFSLLGIAINTAFPKLEFEHETQPIKQSLATFVMMLTSFVVSLIGAGIALLLSVAVSPVLAAIAVLVIYAAAAVGLYFTVCGPCAGKYEKL